MQTLEEVPARATHWSKREPARRVASPVPRAADLAGVRAAAWRAETFKVSPDRLLIDVIRDVVGLYLARPASAAVFSDRKVIGGRSRPRAAGHYAHCDHSDRKLVLR